MACRPNLDSFGIPPSFAGIAYSIMTTFQQDYSPVVIGNKKSGTGGSGVGDSKQVGEKKPQSTGLNGRLDNQTAAKLDSADAKAPEAIGLEIGKVSREK